MPRDVFHFSSGVKVSKGKPNISVGSQWLGLQVIGSRNSEARCPGKDDATGHGMKVGQSQNRSTVKSAPSYLDLFISLRRGALGSRPGGHR